MATKTDIELKIVDSVDTSHTDAEVLTDSAANPDAFYVGRGYLAHNGEKVIEGIDPNGSYPNMSVGNAQKAKEAESATHADTATDLSGRVEATPEVFTYRPSAGEKSIKDDNAFIRRIKGNSVVWNQQLKTLFSPSVTADTVTSNGITFTKLPSGGYNISGSNNTSDFAMSNNISANLELQAGHKYAIIPIGLKKSAISFYGPGSGVSSFVTADMRIITPTNSVGALLRSVVQAGVIDVNETIYCNVHDLTQMFGTGNEPTTIEEFRALYPDSYYPYNAGEFRNLVCSGIKTVGFNQWDEQWERGNINGEIGVNINDTQNIRSANYIPALPNMEYYFHCGTPCSVTICCYDSAYNFLGNILWGGPINRKSKTLPNTSYIRFATYKLSGINYGPTYNNDICINLHHTGWRDGDYEPYKEFTHSLPLSQITNGEPLRKAGSVYDEINETHYIKRVGVVDLGELEWVYSEHLFGGETVAGFKTSIEDVIFANGAATLPNITVSKYNINTADMVANGYATTETFTGYKAYKTNLYAYFTFTTNASALKASLAGVLLNYELAEPIVTPIETPIDFNYYVEDFGTEEALLAEDSAPFSADIVYQFNATDQIRNNSRNIHKLEKSAFTPNGTSAQYIRGDGSYGNMFELTQSKPVNDGEWEKPDESDYYILILQDHIYSKCPEEVSVDHNIQVHITPTNDMTKLAEWWAEIPFGPDPPNELVFKNPSNEEAVIRIAGSAMTDGVNVYHLWSSDGGNTIFGDVKWFSY